MVINLLWQFSVPKDATSIKITAIYKDGEGDGVSVEQRVVLFYSVGDFHVHVSTSTEEGLLGHNAVMHLKSNFAFQDYNYVVSVYYRLFYNLNKF